MSDKQRIKEVLLAQAAEQLATMQAAQEFQHRESEIDDDQEYDRNDVSLADSTSEVEANYVERVDLAKQGLHRVEQLDIAETDVVRQGALVSFDAQHYVVGVPAEAFEVGGVTYEGISVDSPLFPLIAGKRAGDSFTFAGRSHVIESVS